jgi:peptide alpha-N-acetyltransferase
MVNIRQATVKDMLQMQHCNLRNLPENYTYKYYLYHALSWPQLLHVAEDDNGKIVGYVMAKLEDDEEGKKNKLVEAHVTSLSVLRTHRKLGIATKLMRASHHQMKNVLLCHSCSLRVRVTNRAAISLYQDVLGYKIVDTDKGYYADGEDAYDMKVTFDQPIRETESTADEASASGEPVYHMAESNHHHHAHGGGCCGGHDHGHSHDHGAPKQ